MSRRALSLLPLGLVTPLLLLAPLSCQSNKGTRQECAAPRVLCGSDCVDVQQSTGHCGGCEISCVAGGNSTATCINGRCGLQCAGGFLDCNGLLADGCEVAGSCPAGIETNCGNATDDDNDGATDCADSDCATDPRCLPESNCSDGLDDDLDGATDCADTDCAFAAQCLPETNCGDNIDNDGDGTIDCADSDCARVPPCGESGAACSDALDNDADGVADCLDDDCIGEAACPGCPQLDLGGALGDGIAIGYTTNFGDDFPTSGCGDPLGSGEDVALAWTPFTSGCFVFDTSSSAFNTVLRIYDGCEGSEIACDDDRGGAGTSSLRLELGAGQPLVIVIDGYGAADGGLFVLDATYIGPGCP